LGPIHRVLSSLFQLTHLNNHHKAQMPLILYRPALLSTLWLRLLFLPPAPPQIQPLVLQMPQPIQLIQWLHLGHRLPVKLFLELHHPWAKQRLESPQQLPVLLLFRQLSLLAS
jgi:hypothetical protein